MDSTLEWYLTMQRKWKARDSSKQLDWNYTYIFARGGGLYCFDGEDSVMVFDVTRYANKNGPDGRRALDPYGHAPRAGVCQSSCRTTRGPFRGITG